MALVAGRGLGRLSAKPGGSSNLEDKVSGGEERSHGNEGVRGRGVWVPLAEVWSPWRVRPAADEVFHSLL